jgi:hypothetical protein
VMSFPLIRQVEKLLRPVPTKDVALAPVPPTTACPPCSPDTREGFGSLC